jgi:hypothetical protein
MAFGSLVRCWEQRQGGGECEIKGRIPVPEVAIHGLGFGANLALGERAVHSRDIFSLTRHGHTNLHARRGKRIHLTRASPACDRCWRVPTHAADRRRSKGDTFVDIQPAFPHPGYRAGFRLGLGNLCQSNSEITRTATRSRGVRTKSIEEIGILSFRSSGYS